MFLRCIGTLLLAVMVLLPAVQSSDPVISPYGIHSHVTRGDEAPFLKDEMRLMQEAGIQWLRTGFVWAAIEGRKGEWDFSKHDAAVTVAESRGVRILGLLHGTPDWAQPTIEHLDDWLGFVRATVTRYKGRVPAWQVWNEPNLEQFWKDPNPRDYARLLKATYPVIKQTDPQALVVWGGTSVLDWGFLEPALREAGDCFDVMAIHPYGYEDPRAPEAYIPDALEELRVLLGKHGLGGKPLWFTEWGWPSHTGRRGMTDYQQGQYIVRAYLMALTAGLERGFWYEFQERRETDEENEDAFGILEYDLKPKPAYRAYATLIRVRPPGSKTLPGAWNTRLVYHVGWRRPDGKAVQALWNLWGRWKQPRQVEATLEGDLIEACDYLGKPMTLSVGPDGRTVLPLDWGCPLYLVGPQRVTVE